MKETTGRRIRCLCCGAEGFEPIVHYDHCKPITDKSISGVLDTAEFSSSESQRIFELSRDFMNVAAGLMEQKLKE